jgi:hypothetical protein
MAESAGEQPPKGTILQGFSGHARPFHASLRFLDVEQETAIPDLDRGTY